MALATVGAAALGGLLSWVAVSRRLDVIFTGIVTLAFSLGFDNLLLGQRDLTGGETGLVVDAGSQTLLGELVAPYYVFLALVLGYLAVYRLLQRSQIGWAFRALRDDEVAAELAGVDVKRYRVLAGVIGAAMIGLAGALYAHSEGFIAPSTYAFGNVDVRVLVMVAFGGIGTLLGPVVGAAAFTILDEWLVSFNQYRLIIYGVGHARAVPRLPAGLRAGGAVARRPRAGQAPQRFIRHVGTNARFGWTATKAVSHPVELTRGDIEHVVRSFDRNARPRLQRRREHGCVYGACRL